MKTTYALTSILSLITTHVFAQDSISDPKIVGTWTTKSFKTFTGPGFYNPVDDRFIEPELTGISYSFTADGFYEEAWYRAISNPTTPSCPSGLLQWQHGSYTIHANKSITLTPIAVDGRQLTSTPCRYDNSIYTRYHQPGFMKEYTIETDKFHNIPRLNLFQFDGSPQQPLYQAYTPPQMLPTQTLNPTAAPSATGKAKRDNEQIFIHNDAPLNKNAIVIPKELIDAEQVWWAGIGLVVIGSAMYMFPSKQNTKP